MTTSRKQVGKIIRDAREDRGLSIRQAAEKLNIDWSHYAKIETGERTLGKYAKPIAKLFGLNAEELQAIASPTLPNLRPYLRAKFALDDDAIAEIEEHFEAVTGKRPTKRGRS